MSPREIADAQSLIDKAASIQSAYNKWNTNKPRFNKLPLHIWGAASQTKKLAVATRLRTVRNGYHRAFWDFDAQNIARRSSSMQLRYPCNFDFHRWHVTHFSPPGFFLENLNCVVCRFLLRCGVISWIKKR